MDFLDAQSFEYEKEGDGAVILRCFSRGSSIRIPEQMDGLPVLGLAPYAFSAHGGERPLPDVLCGDRLEEISLPGNLRHVGRYCFYDCGHLRRLEFPGGISDWGSGAFTGCHRIGELCVHADPDGSTGLKQVLDELPESLTVEFCAEGEPLPGEEVLPEHQNVPQQKEGPIRARLIIPEFYEEGVENTPARILETHVHGTGIRYRNCFHENRLDFVQYDDLFPYALAQENEDLLLALVLGRLRFPFRLKREAQKTYEEYVRANTLSFGNYFLDKRDPEGLSWYLNRFVGPLQSVPMEAVLNALSEYACRLGDAGAVSRLMDFRSRHLPASAHRKRLSL